MHGVLLENVLLFARPSCVAFYRRQNRASFDSMTMQMEALKTITHASTEANRVLLNIAGSAFCSRFQVT